MSTSTLHTHVHWYLHTNTKPNHTKQKLAKCGWHMPLIPALVRLRQADLCELEATLAYIVSARTARTIERPCLKKHNATSIKEKKKATNKIFF